MEVADTAQVGSGRHDLFDPGLHVRHECCGLIGIAGGLAETGELIVGLVQGARRGQCQGGDACGCQTGDGVGIGHCRDHQIGGVAEDRLDVGRIAGQLRDGSLRGIVRLVVHGDDLVAGIDGEQRLGGRGAERDDGLRTLIDGDRVGRPGSPADHVDGESGRAGALGGLGRGRIVRRSTRRQRGREQ
ncbi:hypothetical protein SDC9_107545 [bioreactor metagenome]|uniref:Uncharacterized protein n=1 Tax=bioreactor metagenome TaxID=1076179 RepID=A0A645BBY9_9ZZZZ